MTNRERAINFVFELPEYKGINKRAIPDYLASRRGSTALALVDKLEKEFDCVSDAWEKESASIIYGPEFANERWSQ
jgi:hypothetical protein